MRLFAIVDMSKLCLVDEVTDDYFFKGKVKAVRDVTDKDETYIAIRKDQKYDILSREEYFQLFGESDVQLDEEVMFCKV